MTADVAILLLGWHGLGFALFHLAFWKLFAWPRTLQSTTRPNRAIIQILNLRLTWVFFGMAAACFVLPGELLGSRLGQGILGFIALFWLGRLIEQFVFLRIHHWLVHSLTLLFVSGLALPLWALYLANTAG